MSDLVLYTVFFTSDHKYNLEPFSLLASSFALVQLGLIFSFVPSFLSESTWPSLSKRQNYQLGSFGFVSIFGRPENLCWQ